MNNIAFLGLSHSPLLGLNPLPTEVDADLRGALASVARRVQDWKPDLLLLVAPDHYNGFVHELMPPFCLGAAATAIGDYDTPAGPLNVPADVAINLAQHLIDQDFDIAMSRRMKVDHGFAQPLQLLFGGLDTPPVMPLFLNAVATPTVPRTSRCLQLGRAIGAHLATLDKRVLVIGSGGLSHDPPLPSLDSPDAAVRERITVRRDMTPAEREARVKGAMAAGMALAAGTATIMDLSPEWDLAWMDAMVSGDLEALAAQSDAHISRTAGGSAHESKTWLVGRGAVDHDPSLSTAFRYYRTIPQLIAGFGILLMLPAA